MQKGSVTVLAGSMPHDRETQQNEAGLWAHTLMRFFFKLGIEGQRALLQTMLGAVP